jgi:hypothetical protein
MSLTFNEMFRSPGQSTAAGNGAAATQDVVMGEFI